MKAQLLVTAVALAVAGCILAMRGLPPDLDAYQAIFLGKEGALEAYLKWSGDANAEVDGGSLLFHAAGLGEVRMVELLVERGADVNAKNCCNWTPLGTASRGREMEQEKLEAHLKEFPGRPEDYDRVIDLLRQHGAKE